MALPTPVNGQITDAAALSAAPSAAITPADTNIRQQLDTILQAATVCLVNVMYSQSSILGAITAQQAGIDTSPSAPSPVSGTEAVQDLLARHTPVTAKPAAAGETTQEPPPTDGLEDWDKGIRDILTTFKKEIWDLHELGNAAALDLIKQAALNQVLKQMVAVPEQFEQLEKIALFIKGV